ncbi:MAG: NUDIX hydrolase [Bacteroidales bacterium]|nr:NUDIX hydrolase [Bacteroidales bacterium]
MINSQYNYPTFHLAVDCIIFGYEEDELKLLITHRNFPPAQGEWSLVGGWVSENETVEAAAARVLFQITGLKDIFMEQVFVFSEPDRDLGGRVISVAFYAMIRIDKHDRDLVNEHGAEWWTLKEIPNLIFDHNSMVEHAHEKLKQKAGYELIGKNLLPGKFTILQLRTLYEAIFQRKFDPGNFRKKILSLKVLERLNDKNTADSKKGAFYYRFINRPQEFMQDRIVRQ